ncbi:unnamed protein product [Amoebophrya sp. A25]|nr:unnamed protein product [Amoebophrya sp. A25]|eukprot:GSA25T00016218001.1
MQRQPHLFESMTHEEEEEEVKKTITRIHRVHPKVGGHTTVTFSTEKGSACCREGARALTYTIMKRNAKQVCKRGRSAFAIHHVRVMITTDGPPSTWVRHLLILTFISLISRLTRY